MDMITTAARRPKAGAPLRKLRPARIRVQHSANKADIFHIVVGPLDSLEKPEAHAAAWRDAWFHTWCCVPELLNTPGPFNLIVETAAMWLPEPIARDPELVGTLYQETYRREGLTLAELGGRVLRYIHRSEGAQATTR